MAGRLPNFCFSMWLFYRLWYSVTTRSNTLYIHPARILPTTENIVSLSEVAGLMNEHSLKALSPLLINQLLLAIPFLATESMTALLRLGKLCVRGSKSSANWLSVELLCNIERCHLVLVEQNFKSEPVRKPKRPQITKDVERLIEGVWVSKINVFKSFL